jgi:hypothetical protein
MCIHNTIFCYIWILLVSSSHSIFMYYHARHPYYHIFVYRLDMLSVPSSSLMWTNTVYCNIYLQLYYIPACRLFMYLLSVTVPTDFLHLFVCTGWAVYCIATMPLLPCRLYSLPAWRRSLLIVPSLTAFTLLPSAMEVGADALCLPCASLLLPVWMPARCIQLWFLNITFNAFTFVPSAVPYHVAPGLAKYHACLW